MSVARTIASEHCYCFGVHLVTDHPQTKIGHHLNLMIVEYTVAHHCFILPSVRPPEEIVAHTIRFFIVISFLHRALWTVKSLSNGNC